MRGVWKVWWLSVPVWAGAACGGVMAGQPAEHTPASISQSVSRYLAGGYLPQDGLPDSLAFNPPPPAPGSAAMARDEEAAARAGSLQGTARWDLAKSDAELATTGTAFLSCAAGVALGATTTPHTQALLARAAKDLALATYPTKLKYQRTRPFMANGRPLCTPGMADMLRHDGSYPSGHSAIGYGWALILAELIPTRSAGIVARGRSFGDSRRVCNAHWLSDIEEGRIVASAVVARLHAEPSFRADLDAARAELARPGLAAPAPADCARETAALAVPQPGYTKAR